MAINREVTSLYNEVYKIVDDLVGFTHITRTKTPNNTRIAVWSGREAYWRAKTSIMLYMPEVPEGAPAEVELGIRCDGLSLETLNLRVRGGMRSLKEVERVIEKFINHWGELPTKKENEGELLKNLYKVCKKDKSEVGVDPLFFLGRVLSSGDRIMGVSMIGAEVKF